MRHQIIRLIESKYNDDYRITGNYVYIKCPLAKNKHSSGKDTRNSCAINLITSQFYCHSCSARGAGIEIIKKLLGYKNNLYLTSRDIFPEIKEKESYRKIEFPDFYCSISDLKGKPGFDYITQDRSPKYSKRDVEILLKYFNISFCYRNNRNQSEGIRLKDYLIIPFECNGFKTFSSRCVYKNNLKHFHPKGSNVGSLLLNYDNQDSDTIILVEGPFDLFRLITYKYNNVVATFGKKISSAQKSLLLKKKSKLQNIILMLDGEAKEDAIKLAKEFSIFFNVAVCDLKEWEQPDTISKFQADKYLSTALSSLRY